MWKKSIFKPGMCCAGDELVGMLCHGWSVPGESFYSRAGPRDSAMSSLRDPDLVFQNNTLLQALGQVPLPTFWNKVGSTKKKKNKPFNLQSRSRGKFWELRVIFPEPSPSLLFLLPPPSTLLPPPAGGNTEWGSLTKPVSHEELSSLLRDADSSRAQSIKNSHVAPELVQFQRLMENHYC